MCPTLQTVREVYAYGQTVKDRKSAYGQTVRCDNLLMRSRKKKVNPKVNPNVNPKVNPMVKTKR